MKLVISDTRVPVINTETGQRLTGDQAPKVGNLGQWLSANPKFIMDISSASGSAASSSKAMMNKLSNSKVFLNSKKSEKIAALAQTIKANANSSVSISKNEKPQIPTKKSSTFENVSC